MKRAILSIAVAIMMILQVSTVFACEFCTVHQGGNFLEHNNYVSLTYRSTVAATDAANNVYTPSAMKLTINTAQFLANYNLSEEFGAALVVPQLSKTHEDPAMAATDSSSGIGDIVTLGRYFLLKSPETGKLALQGGVKWASGARVVDSMTGVMSPDLTLGTGSTDYLAGVAYSRTLGDLLLTADLLYAVKNAGYDGYQFGNALNYNLYASYRLQPNFYLMLNGFGESTAQDSDNGAVQADTGGNVVYLSPGFQWIFSGAILEVNYQTPVGRSFNGAQMVVDNKWLASLKYLF